MRRLGISTTLLLIGAAALGIANAEVPAPVSGPKDAAPLASSGDAGVAPSVVQPSDPAPEAMKGSARLVSLLRSKSGLPTLVGKSGELYEPAADLAWQRGSAGGVSTDVLALYPSGTSDFFAVGSRAPLFRRRAGVWSAFHLGNRGRAAVSSGPAPIIAVGRHLYELTGSSWMRIASAKGKVRALFASRPNQIYLVTTRGQLYVGRKSWRKLSIKLGADDEIRSIVGVPGKQTVALTKKNKLYLLQKKGAKLLTLGPELRGLKIHAMGVAANTVLLAGQLGSGATAKTLLVKVEKNTASAAGELWPLQPGDRFALLYEDPQNRLLVASHQGQLRLREKNGRWRNGEVDIAPPPPPENFTKSGPALAK